MFALSLAVLLPCLTSAVIINCDFQLEKVSNLNLYDCSVKTSLNVTVSDRTILDITGNHIQQYSNFKVQKLIIKNQNVQVIPRPLAAYIPNLNVLEITSSKLTVLKSGDLKGLKLLEQLYLGNNLIEVLLPNTFEFNLRLTTVSLRYNKLKSIASKIFVPLKGLVNVHLDGNICISARLTPRDSISTLMNLVNNKCKLPYPLDEVIGMLPLGQCQSCGTEIDISLMTKNANCKFSIQNQIGYTCNIGGVVKVGPTGRLAESQLEILSPAIRNVVYLGVHEARKTNLDVESLIATDQIIKFIPINMFDDFPNVRTISITNSGLISITKKTFAGLPKLVNLNLAGNEIALLDVNVFIGNPLLSSLNLSGNKIEIISKLALNGLTNLEALSLANNLLTKVPDRLLSALPKLKDVNVLGNLCINEKLDSVYKDTVGTILQTLHPLSVLNIPLLGRKAPQKPVNVLPAVFDKGDMVIKKVLSVRLLNKAKDDKGNTVKVLADNLNNVIETTLDKNGAILSSIVRQIGGAQSRSYDSNSYSSYPIYGRRLLVNNAHGTGNLLPGVSNIVPGGLLVGGNIVPDIGSVLPGALSSGLDLNDVLSNVGGTVGGLTNTVDETLSGVGSLTDDLPIGVTLPPLALPNLGIDSSGENPSEESSNGAINLGNVLKGVVSEDGKIVLGSVDASGNILSSVGRLVRSAAKEVLGLITAAVNENGDIHIRIKNPLTGEKFIIPKLDISHLNIGLDVNGRISGILSKIPPILGSQCS